ncbi:hypothetical protein ACQY0O_004227 [Thecaphora frezii]
MLARGNRRWSPRGTCFCRLTTSQRPCPWLHLPRRTLRLASNAGLKHSYTSPSCHLDALFSDTSSLTASAPRLRPAPHPFLLLRVASRPPPSLFHPYPQPPSSRPATSNLFAMLTSNSYNTTSIRMESSTHKLCCASDSKKASKEIEAASKLKAMKDGLKAKKESKGPILKRKMACATCRRRKLRCDAARPRCSTCARSQASAEAAGHPSAVPSGPCVYDCDQHDEPAPGRFFPNGAFHSLTFHSSLCPPMPGPMESVRSMESLNMLPQSSPYGVWTWGEVPLTPSRPTTAFASAPMMSPPVTTTPSRPPSLMSTPMRRIINPGLTINAPPYQEYNGFNSPTSQSTWTPSPQQLSAEPMFVSPMVSPQVANFSEAMYPSSSASSGASTPSLISSRSIRSPFGMMQDLGTPTSLEPSTPCSETFDSKFLGPPILSAQDQRLKCTSFLDSLEPAPLDMVDPSNHMYVGPGPQEPLAIVSDNQLGLVDGMMGYKLREPFDSMQFGFDDLPSFELGNNLMTSALSGAMPHDGLSHVSVPDTNSALQWAF